ncbi:MAG: CvpA family protein [Planctomycetes bacterium]|nr:CvpA family protein [Planctomycetota bacterium]
MAFWIAILIGLIVALIYSQRGLYEAIILAFNGILSVYLSLYLTPTMVSRIPSAIDVPGGLSLAILLLFVLCFGLLWVASFFLFTGQFAVSLAKGLEWLGGGIVGFFTGFLVTNFLLLVLTLGSIPGLPEWTLNMDVTTNTQITCAVCDTSHQWIGADRQYKTAKLLAWLNEKAQETRPPTGVDPNSEPNAAQDG